MTDSKTEPEVSTLDRLKSATNWLGCSSQALQPTEIRLGVLLFKEGLDMLTGPDAPPIMKLHDIPVISDPSLPSYSFAFVFHHKELK